MFIVILEVAHVLVGQRYFFSFLVIYLGVFFPLLEMVVLYVADIVK